MASEPGVLTRWPWHQLGSFKYVVLAPWVVHSVYSFTTKSKEERDLVNFLVLPFLLWRAIHNQIWITISRHRTARGNTRIVDKGIEFDQVDRESNWDDQIILSGIAIYTLNLTVGGASQLPMWRTDGVVLIVLLHSGPVEFLYYWLHRALHHHYLYSRYHSHHHSSIVTEPITSVIHPFGEHLAYFLLFAIPTVSTMLTGTASILGLFGYITYIDFMNNMGHCNFELIPKKLFFIFPPLKYIMYTPTFHSLHHTQFRTNYSLFMPIYDYIYGSVDKSTDLLHETSLKREEETPNVVHLTHLTTPDSIYHLQIAFSSLASMPQIPKWYLSFLWPLTCCSMLMAFVYGRTFVVDRNSLGKLRLQSWAVPRYTMQYLSEWQRQPIIGLIEEAILEADARGIKVLSLGLLNQGEELNGNGELYIQKHPHLKIMVVDGSSLTVALVLNSIPKGTTKVLFRGSLSKVALSIVSILSQRGIQISTFYKTECEKLQLATGFKNNLTLSRSYAEKIWLVGEGLSEAEQLKAPKGTLFIPFSPFPLKKSRKDCFYHLPPSMMAPSSLQNLHSCENWLPRRAMSAARVAGIVHALEGWEENECEQNVLEFEKAWKASLKHGFKPQMILNS